MVTANDLEDLELVAKGMCYVKHKEGDVQDLMRNVLRILVEMDYYDVVESGVSVKTQRVIFNFQESLRDIELQFLYAKHLPWTTSDTRSTLSDESTTQ